ncbi:MAG: glycosyltransferase family 2 protein [Moorea sp. SIO2B7]|nr:glycosyltransferase family 2 protein [Moorena sp. SIO2B7]
MMDIAVIIPMYNGAKWIRTTIESVMTQTCLPTEIIVVDNNSTDNSVEIIREFPEIKIINNPIKGANFSRQSGFKASTASLIAYLDQDDIWHPEHLNYLCRLLEQYPDYPAAVASSLSFRFSKNLRFTLPKFEEFDYNPWSIFPNNKIVTPSSLMIRRTALESIGGWQTQFNFCGDTYTWLRLSVNHSFIQNKGITVGYRRHNSSQSATLLIDNTQKCFDSLFAALEDALTYYPTVSEQDYSKLKRRLAALSASSDILSNTINFEPSQLSKSILIFEQSLSEENKWFVRSICGTLVWLLYNHLANKPFLLSRLLEYWPQEASRTGQAFRSLIASSRILPKCLLSEPFNIQLWLILLQSLDDIITKIPLYRQ